jgi:hypothetical protein
MLRVAAPFFTANVLTVIYLETDMGTSNLVFKRYKIVLLARNHNTIPSVQFVDLHPLLYQCQGYVV